MSDKKPRWENEMLGGKPIPDDIVCKTCMFRLPPVTIRGETQKRHTFGNCKIYEGTDNKPPEILLDHGKCEYYEKG